MAVIEIEKSGLDDLLGTEVDAQRLEAEGSMLGILFEPQGDGTIEVEVEPNRPDLLGVEGVARALRGFLDIDPGFVDYPVRDSDVAVAVDDAVADVRPHIACARIRGLDLNQDALDSIIQLQEKLTETYGRKRAKIAIGLHDFAAVEAPITYTAVKPGEHAFEPLGGDEELTPAEILEQHEKGREYGWILEGADRYPLIEDVNGTVLSMPPVINGTATEVTTDTDDVFLDVTGTSRDEVVTALHILVAALHERGGAIESVSVDGERMPDMSGEEFVLDPEYVREVSGLDDLSDHGIAEELEKMNYAAEVVDGEIVATVPAYRADIMHAYDLIEDVVVAYGYDNVNPSIPDVSTIGGLSDEQVFVDRLREFMVGAGAQELMTFILSNREKLFAKMERAEDELVEMANPLTEDYAVVRDRLLPSLMATLARNQHNRSPQRIFEVGRVAAPADTPTGAEDVSRLAYASSHPDAGFDEARGVLQSLATHLGLDLSVSAADRPSFASKRCGTVSMDGEEVGVIGEVSADVLDNWELDDPVVAFELDVAALRRLVGDR